MPPSSQNRQQPHIFAYDGADQAGAQRRAEA